MEAIGSLLVRESFAVCYKGRGVNEDLFLGGRGTVDPTVPLSRTEKIDSAMCVHQYAIAIAIAASYAAPACPDTHYPAAVVVVAEHATINVANKAPAPDYKLQRDF